VRPSSQALWLWAGTLAHASLAERIEAACAGGFSNLSLFPEDYRRARADGLTDSDILAMHEEKGVRLMTLDPYARWLPFDPPAAADPRLRILQTEESEFFAIADALQLQTMTAIEPFGHSHPIERLAESFARLCDRAAESGLRVHLEFTPFSGIPDLSTAFEVVRLAGRANGGLVLDTWHYLRGQRDDELLRSIPAECIFVVQVSDARAQVQGSLIEDTWAHRMLPGEGELDLQTVIAILAGKRGVGPFGIEVLSRTLWQLPPAEIGRQCGESLRELIRLAGG
jgi:sugar phosphate isomerase/epimerase